MNAHQALNSTSALHQWLHDLHIVIAQQRHVPLARHEVRLAIGDGFRQVLPIGERHQRVAFPVPDMDWDMDLFEREALGQRLQLPIPGHAARALLEGAHHHLR